MSRRNWTREHPTSMRQAIEMCLDYAREARRLTVDAVAEEMEEDSKWTVYGWLRDGSIPGRKIRKFQRACRCDFITRFLAHSDGQMLIRIPIGRMADAHDVHKLQATLNDAVKALLDFAAGKTDPDQVGADMNRALEALGWHRENVRKIAQPDLDLGGADHE